MVSIKLNRKEKKQEETTPEGGNLPHSRFEQKSTRRMVTILSVIVVIVVIIILAMVGILLSQQFAPGLITGILGSVIPGLAPEDPAGTGEEEKGPWGEKVYSWTYQGVKYQTELSISKLAYKNSNNPVGGYDLSRYIVDDDDRTVRHLTSNLERLAREHKLSDREVVDFVAAFTTAITYSPDKTSGHAANYPRTPTVTLAEKTGDSKDLSILAAAILDTMGYSVAVLNYPDSNFGGTYVPGAAAIAVPGDSTVNGPTYNITRGTEPEPFEVIWIADTAKLGYPDVAYFALEPEICTAPHFWSGKDYKEVQKSTLPLAETFHIPEITYVPDVSWNTWKKEMSEFYAGKWYETKVSWKSSASWKFYEHIFTVQPTPASLAKPSEDGILPGSLWRLSYKVTPTVNGLVGKETLSQEEEEEEEGKSSSGRSGLGSIFEGAIKKLTGSESVTVDVTGLTPYSAVEIALYDMSSGKPELIDTFGWQGTNSADSIQTSPVYPPGKYAVGLYVRNAEVEINVQCSDDLNEVTYKGGI